MTFGSTLLVLMINWATATGGCLGRRLAEESVCLTRLKDIGVKIAPAMGRFDFPNNSERPSPHR